MAISKKNSVEVSQKQFFERNRRLMNNSSCSAGALDIDEESDGNSQDVVSNQQMNNRQSVGSKRSNLHLRWMTANAQSSGSTTATNNGDSSRKRGKKRDRTVSMDLCSLLIANTSTNKKSTATENHRIETPSLEDVKNSRIQQKDSSFDSTVMNEHDSNSSINLSGNQSLLCDDSEGANKTDNESDYDDEDEVSSSDRMCARFFLSVIAICIGQLNLLALLLY